jgi:VWFA-related protein
MSDIVQIDRYPVAAFSGRRSISSRSALCSPVSKPSSLWKRLFAFPAVLTAIFFSAQYSRAQNDDVIKVQTELAVFEVTVTDKKGNPVRNLSAGDFRLFEDGVERPIDFFQPIKKQDDGRPLSIVFALDVSGSMTVEELERLRSAMQSFTDRLGDYNSYFAVMSFAMDVRTLASFTNRPDRLEKSFQKLARDQNGLSTHAYDAVDDAIRLLARKSPKSIKDRLPKRAVIVITDGFPVGDTVAPETVIERANAAETTVYSVILPSYSRLQRSPGPLPTPLEASGLIQRTGGKSFYATEKNFDPLFKSLAEEVTASYALAIYPKGENDTARPRQVRIESKEGYVIRQNRTSYTLK